jgi:HD superfamily phosphodiesterase
MEIPYNKIYEFIEKRCIDLNIDESHAVKHSMDVLKYSQKILEKEIKINSQNNNLDKTIIYTSAMIHDMCDSKYMNEKKGLNDIRKLLVDLNYNENDINVILKIIGTMSYSKVKKNGFPIIQNYQKEYHIVREADLLSGYDVERCIVYGMIGRKFNYIDSVKATEELYYKRMATQIEDNLFTTNYALIEANKLDKENRQRLKELKNLLP